MLDPSVVEEAARCLVNLIPSAHCLVNLPVRPRTSAPSREPHPSARPRKPQPYPLALGPAWYSANPSALLPAPPALPAPCPPPPPQGPAASAVAPPQPPRLEAAPGEQPAPEHAVKGGREKLRWRRRAQRRRQLQEDGAEGRGDGDGGAAAAAAAAPFAKAAGREGKAEKEAPPLGAEVASMASALASLLFLASPPLSAGQNADPAPAQGCQGSAPLQEKVLQRQVESTFTV